MPPNTELKWAGCLRCNISSWLDKRTTGSSAIGFLLIKTGEAVITPGCFYRATHIHVAGRSIIPSCHKESEKLLRAAYLNSLILAKGL